MNYEELKVNIANICENTFTDEEYALFTEQAEQRIYNTVQLANLRKNVTGTLTSSNKYLSAPSDFLSVYSIAIVMPSGEFRYLLNKDVNFIREAYPNSTTLGTPKYYALFGPAIVSNEITNELTFILGPTPSANLTIELHFYYYPESIVTAGSSWLGDNFDTVLLYGALVEAYTYMKGEADLLQLYVAKYTEAMQQAKRLGDGLERQDAYRSGQARVAVQ